MTILELIAKAHPALAHLREELIEYSEKYPDLAESLAPKIAALEAVADPAGLAELGMTVISELKALPSKGLDPRNNPSNMAG